MSTKPFYLNLRQTAARRLSDLRVQAQKLAFNAGAEKTWRDVRSWGFHNWENAFANFGQGFNGADGDKKAVWYSHTGEKFRNECFADECEDAPRYIQDNQGYYSDDCCDSTVRGIVARLSHGRFIAGYYWSNNGERVYFNEVHTSERDAAIAADGYAETYAEICREDDEKFQAARKLEDENETALQRLRECLALRNNKCFAALRDEAHDLMETIRANRETLKTEYAAYA